jgi:hypothetical protein
MTVAIALSTLATAAMADQITVGTMFAAGALLGVGVQSTKICVDATLQLHLADTVRGRVFAAYDIIFNLCLVAGAGLAVIGSAAPVLWFAAALFAAAAGALHAMTRINLAVRPTTA